MTRQNLYEGMYIIRPTLSDDAREKAVEKILSSIERLGGSFKKKIEMGRRKMAYDIKGCREGYFFLLYFQLPTSGMNELIEGNHLNEDLLRFMHMLTLEVPEANEISFKSLQLTER